MTTAKALSGVAIVCLTLLALPGRGNAKKLPKPVAPQALSASENEIDASKPAPALASANPSASCRLPDSFLTFSNGLATYYGDIDSFIRYALLNNGYREYAYYAIPGGFALVTRMERIDDNGQSMPLKQRWAPNQTPIHPFTNFSAYFAMLAKAKPGKYRVIIFMVSSEELILGRTTPNCIGMKKSFADGISSLPADMSNRPYTFGDHGDALIYLFNKSDDMTISVIPGAPEEGKRQLQKAGIWRYLAH
jgi:hypothetical protein